jgi:hypothetical protein
MNTAALITPAVLPRSTLGLAKSFDAAIFSDFPQTKPTSANEANAKKTSKNNVGR